MLRDAVRRFAEDVVAPRVEAMDEAEKMDPAVIKGLFEQGLMGIETDPEFGGAGGSFTSAIIVIEELAKVDASVSVLCDVHNTLVDTVMRKYASKELQEKYLPQLSESKLGSFCLSEPASGSDAFAMKTSCKKSDDGKHWIINGSKMWITNSAEAVSRRAKRSRCLAAPLLTSHSSASRLPLGLLYRLRARRPLQGIQGHQRLCR